MSKLDDALRPVKDKSVQGKELIKIDIKILMLEIFYKALKTRSVDKMGETFRKEVDAL